MSLWQNRQKSGNALLLKKRNEAKDFSPSNFTTIVNSLMTTQFMSLDEAKTSAVDLFSSRAPVEPKNPKCRNLVRYVLLDAAQLCESVQVHYQTIQD